MAESKNRVPSRSANRPATRSQRRHGRSAEARAEARRAEAERRRRVRNIQLTISIVVVLVLAVVGGVVWNRLDPQSTAAEPAPQPSAGSVAPTLSDQTHFLSGDPQSRVILVEFLDFECEACGSVYPSIEQIRQRYDGADLAIAVKYFPIESHFNARRAARAVEAAAQQGKFVEMYKLMYDTQREWGEQQTPMDDRFRGYAEQLGLDVAAWETAYASPATDQRIQADVDEGQRLQVSGTPTFFLNGVLVQPQSEQDLTAAIDAELAR